MTSLSQELDLRKPVFAFSKGGVSAGRHERLANLKELSERLGLSQTTVSRALNGYPEVSEATRKRVVAAASELSYQPNQNARKLATGKSRTIGHVVPLGDHDMINPHFSDFIAGAGAVYNQNGYDMLLKVVTVDEEQDAYRDLAIGNRIDGVIVHGPIVGDARPAALSKLGLPFVVHGRLIDTADGYAWVDVDNVGVFKAATEHLLGLGHKRLGLINGLETMVFAVHRREGFEQALQAAGLSSDQRLMRSVEMTEPNGYEATKSLLEHDDAPSAILCASSLVALGATRAVRDLGLKLGEDISLVTFDDCLSFLGGGNTSEVETTAIRSSLRSAGEVAAQLLLGIIDGSAKETQVFMDTEFVLGKTTSPISKG
ncbi:MAG: substrate-binding domain-containing protein [Pseudomonadota bacterium]